MFNKCRNVTLVKKADGRHTCSTLSLTEISSVRNSDSRR